MAVEMASLKTASLPALKRHHLLAEFAGLKQACPEGVFVSLTPGDVSLWSGVIFVRKGPYAPAVLRFQISFPDTYPSLPPLVTFSTDMFHPLITPLTTYMYTTDIQNNGTVSATDEERLPPGGFSLRHGFTGWFGRGSRSRQASSQTGSPAAPSLGSQTPPRQASSGADVPGSAGSSKHTTPVPRSGATVGSPGSVASFLQTHRKDISTFDVLWYIRSTFDDEGVLDAVPLEAAGNPGAWHAWRTYRNRQQSVGSSSMASTSTGTGTSNRDKPLPSSPSPTPGGKRPAGGTALGAAPPLPRRPGEWNWDGVWEERSKKNIATSLSEAVLYGNAGVADDVINFLSMDEAEVEATKANLLRTLGAEA